MAHPTIIDRKQRKVADEYVRLCGFKHGEIGGGHQRSHYGISAQLSLSEIAQQLGTSRTNLTRALAIERNLTEDMKNCLDKGVFSKTVAERTPTLKQGSAFLILKNKE